MHNKVIIIGNDHSNTLGVIRAFGENNIEPYIYIISKYTRVSVIKSKYVKKYKIFEDEKSAIKELIKDFQCEREKAFLIPTSDRAAAIIDESFDELSKIFYTQNINNRSNEIKKYMDKYTQYSLAKDNNIKMASSITINKPFKINDNIEYPSIIKPLLSIDGQKHDIMIAENEDDLRRIFKFYDKNNYDRILIQKLINFDYECDMSGYCYDNSVCIAGYIKKERIWPQKKGSLTFGRVKKYSEFINELEAIKKIFIELKYNGMFDVEFFVKGNEIYLNEINFRNSGLTYLYGNSYLCYYYYKSCIEKKFIEAPPVENEYYIMDEQAEIHQILDKNISILEHIKDRKKSKILLVKNKKDPKPARTMLINKIRRNLKGKKNENR